MIYLALSLTMIAALPLLDPSMNTVKALDIGCSWVTLGKTKGICQIIILGIKMATRHFGKAPDTVILPYSSEQLSWLQSQFDEWTIQTLVKLLGAPPAGPR